MPVQTQLQQRRGTAASWTSTNPTLAAGEIGFETDTGKFKIGNGSTAWAALAYTAASTAVTYLFNATASQTTFSGADANGLTLAYTVGAEQVYLNGVLQVRGSDYTGTDGTSIVLTSGAVVSDVLNVIAFSAMTVTDTYTQAQADAKFFQTANAFLAGKNKIINGDFRINQRAFTSVTTTATYGFDRWQILLSGDGSCTYTPQTFTAGAAPVAGYEAINFARLVTASQTTTTVRTYMQQLIEDVRTFAGQTITVSFWAKAATGTPKVAIEIGQTFGTTGSAGVNTYAGQVTLSTAWARYSVTVALPSVSGKTIDNSNSALGIRLWTSAGSDFNSRTGSLGIQNGTFDFWGVQAEAGSIATPFQTATGTIAGELAACQRYYCRLGGSNTYDALGQGYATSTGGVAGYTKLPVTMRVSPTSMDYSTIATYDGSVITGTPDSVVLVSAESGKDYAKIGFSKTASFTQYRPYTIISNNSTSAYLGFSAEL